MQALLHRRQTRGGPLIGRPVFHFYQKPDAALQQNHPGVAAALDGLFIPDTGLHLADVGLEPRPAVAGRGPHRFYLRGANESPRHQGFAEQNAWTRPKARAWARPNRRQSRTTPASRQAWMVCSSQTLACTSPMWALSPARPWPGGDPTDFICAGRMNRPGIKVLQSKTLGRAQRRGPGQGPIGVRAESPRRRGRPGWSVHPRHWPVPRRCGPCPARACTGGTGRCRRRW